MSNASLVSPIALLRISVRRVDEIADFNWIGIIGRSSVSDVVRMGYLEAFELRLVGLVGLQRFYDSYREIGCSGVVRLPWYAFF